MIDNEPKPPARPGLLDPDADEPGWTICLTGAKWRGVAEVELRLVAVVAPQTVAQIAPNSRRYGLVHSERQVFQRVGGGLANFHLLRLPQSAVALSTAHQLLPLRPAEMVALAPKSGNSWSCSISPRMGHR